MNHCFRCFQQHLKWLHEKRKVDYNRFTNYEMDINLYSFPVKILIIAYYYVKLMSPESKSGLKLRL